MVSLDFQSSDNSSIYFVSRPVRLLARTLCGHGSKLIPRTGFPQLRFPVLREWYKISPTSKTLLGFQRVQAQYLSIYLVERKVLQRRSDPKRISQTLVQIGRADSYKINQQKEGTVPPKGELTIYSAKLKFDAHFEGLR